MRKPLIPFIALCLAAPGAFLLVYRTYAWSEWFAMTSLLAGVLLALTLLVWSCICVYRKERRGLLGLLACAYCFWQLLVIPGFVHAMKIRREQEQPNHPTAGKAGIASVFAFVHHRPGLPEPARSAI